ncbi:hypothetical protein AGDE_13645 [Angomonas deanei]|uniref:Uncharacterized protein n=1 Tax=Angomonas deanei TaxID=59799 RepID=A0A7G2CME5_9TRYP|nr:hypothetical protein AGDE_13645 [Angomonas deanei]CAD2220081.1 hypothetical protein, conserved [Angomonas deanei]|eukprot:EPY21949.1 hypothetical protein AGDE_13645 [Angomonas deanei]
MRDRARPRSVHVLGHSARSYGGEEGLPNCPRSAFLGEGAPMSFWVAQLNERPVTQLDPLDEAEVFSVDSELSRLSEGDRLLDAEERINRLKELEAKRRKREQQEREQYSHFSRFSDTDTTVTSSMDVIDTAEEERQRHAELSQRKLRSISPPHVQHTMHTQSYDPYTNLF